MNSPFPGPVCTLMLGGEVGVETQAHPVLQVPAQGPSQQQPCDTSLYFPGALPCLKSVLAASQKLFPHVPDPCQQLSALALAATQEHHSLPRSLLED